jgi:signal transduction histidine kinase
MSTVYIADDNDTDRLILESALCKLGYEVMAFSDGDELYQGLRSAGKPVVALIDWQMPGRDGVEICRELSVAPPANPVYTIIVTGRTDKKDVAYALDNGADEFASKPFDITELRARINVGIRMVTFRQQLLEGNARLLEYTRQVETLASERAEQLVRADRLSTIGMLSAGMAHEINNPTTFISVNIKTIEEQLPVLMESLRENATGEQRLQGMCFVAALPEILTEMNSGITRIRKIVNGLKTYVRQDEGKYDRYSIDTCIDSALLLCANRIKYRINVKKQIGSTPPLYGDQYAIEQVLVNLITNAADAIDSTGRHGELVISAVHSDGQVVVSVHDSGPGIPSGHFEKIFLPFFTTKSAANGTGLGLSISRNIIREHHGDLTADNSPGGGAVFRITLPVIKGGLS